MSYYILGLSVNTKETGPIYPQVQKMALGYNYKSFNSVHALSRETEKLPDYEPNLNYFILHNKAKSSDFLSVSVLHGGFLITEKVKNIFEQFKLPAHKFYPSKVHFKTQQLDYYWMHIICNLTDLIDYPKSVFFIYQNYSTNLGYIDISSKEDFIQKAKKLKDINPGKTIAIWAEKLVFSQAFDKSLSLFKIGTFDSNYYISEQLQMAIIENNLTGCTLAQSKILEI